MLTPGPDHPIDIAPAKTRWRDNRLAALAAHLNREAAWPAEPKH